MISKSFDAFKQIINSTNFSLKLAAIVSGGKGTTQDKIKTLKEAGVTVVESPAKIGSAMLEVYYKSEQTYYYATNMFTFIFSGMLPITNSTVGFLIS